MFFLIPKKIFFTIAFVFGDKVVAEVEKSDLPNEMIDELKNARKYTEARGIMLEIKKKEMIHYVINMSEIKIEN